MPHLFYAICLCFFLCCVSIPLKQVGKLKLSQIGLGTWAWGNRFLWNYSKDQDDELAKAYQYSIKKGINWFDTADSYGTGSLEGQSEKLLGQFRKQLSKSTKSPNICTKLAPYPWRIGPDSMKKAANESIQRLNQPKIDILQLHWPPSLQWQEQSYLQAFSELVDNEQATQIGVSNYGPIGIKRIQNILKQYGPQVYSNQVSITTYTLIILPIYLPIYQTHFCVGLY